ARATGESAAELRTHYNLGSLYFEQSDFEQAEHAYRRAYTRAREIGRPWAAFGMDARAMVGLVQYIRGDWDGALRTLDVANESATPQAEALYAATAMAIRAGRGDRSALELLMPLRDWWERESRAALYSVGAEGLAWQARLVAEWARLRWLCDIDPPEEKEHIEAWRAAVDLFSYGNTFEQARARSGLVSVLRAAGETREAAEQAALAAEVARALGAAPLLAEVGGAAVSARAQTSPDALTGREREVLALLVEGRTNRQIGRQLYISEKTASVHVSNILAKLQVGSRTEAAAVARRDGLLS